MTATHLLLIPCDPITMEQATEVRALLIERLPSWVEPALIGGARGSAVLIPIGPPVPNVNNLEKLTYPSIVPPAEWAEQWVADAIERLGGTETT